LLLLTMHVLEIIFLIEYSWLFLEFTLSITRILFFSRIAVNQDSLLVTELFIHNSSSTMTNVQRLKIKKSETRKTNKLQVKREN